MSGALLIIAGLMFGIPLILMVVIAATGGDIPSNLLFFGGWSMAFGVITGAIGAYLGSAGG